MKNMNALCGREAGIRETGRPVAAVRRIGVRLQEREKREPIKAGGERREGIHVRKALKEVLSEGGGGRSHAEPDPRMFTKDAEPAVQDGMRDRIGVVDLLGRHGMGIVQAQYVQDE